VQHGRGSVISSLHRRHRTIEFKKFQAKIDATVPADLHAHLIDGIPDGSEFQSEVSSRDTGSNSCAKLTCAFRFVAGDARRLQGGG
jgi:hypothetical protein